jgi:hypothetical protein
MAEKHPTPKPCAMYWAGHHVHWIQANKTDQEPAAVERVEVIGVEGNQVMLAVDGSSRLYFNHDAARILSVARAYDHRGVFIPRWSVLSIPGTFFTAAFDLDEERTIDVGGGSYLFYLATEKSWRPCKASA